MRSVIFAGRFQPFHVGHLAVANSMIGRLEFGDLFTLAVIAPCPLAKEATDKDFASNAAEHHRPERNPWPLAIRLLAIRSIATMLQARNPELLMATTAIPRPDYDWKAITEWFPGNRLWVIPKAGELFDEQKAAFFVAQGDQVTRVIDSTHVSGMDLRKYWSDGNVTQFESGIPECVRKAYQMVES